MTVFAKILITCFVLSAALGQWKCWLAMLPTPVLDARGVRLEGSEAPASLVYLGISVAEVILNVTCIDCTGPQMPVLTKLLEEAQAIDDVTAVANDVLGYVTDLLEGGFLQMTMDRIVADAKLQCPFSPDYDEDAVPRTFEPFENPERSDSFAFLVAVMITAFTIIVGISAVLLAKRMFVRIRHRRWLQTLAREKLVILTAQQRQVDDTTNEVNRTTSSMFKSASTPLLVRVGIPMVILGNIAFFLSGHLSLGGSVTIIATFAGEAVSSSLCCKMAA